MQNGTMTRTRMLITGGVMIAVAVGLGWVVSVGLDGLDAGLDSAWNTVMIAVRHPWTLAAAQALNVIGGGWVATGLVPALIIGLLLILRRPQAAVYAAAALVLSVVLTQLVKELYGRARPEELLVASDHGSFPSGHTANAATVAVILYVAFPRRWVGIAGIAWTFAMALSRTVLSVHWLTDTLGGMLIGTGAALVVAALLGRWAKLGPWSGSVSPGRGPLTDREPIVDTGSTTARTADDATVTPASSIRPYRPSDREAMYDVCVRTADAGVGAVGVLADDRLWGDIWAVPYVERHPDLAWVVESADGRTTGYIVATDDTEAFETWFRDEWWPGVAERYPLSGQAEPTRMDGLIAYAAGRGPGRERHAAAYPAHLHIDLLPETQGQGLGRRLIETLFDELRCRGVPGVHLGMNPSNTGAGRFYERLGMHRLDSGPETTMYGIRL